ncbi:MAG: hypothetical protein WCZ86_04700 [Desulfurivibrionaceae bacterium]|jgi:hypothetical protein
MRGVYLEAELMNSDAFKSLSKWGMHVYLRFLTKRVIAKEKHKSKSDSRRIVNNGKIVFCYSEAEKGGIPRREFRNGLDELIDKGFIDIDHQGAGGRSKDMSTYYVADRWMKWGKPDYQTTKKPRVKDTLLGRGWAAYNAQKKQLSVTNMTPETPLSSDKIDTPKGKTKVFRVTNMTPGKSQKIASSC